MAKAGKQTKAFAQVARADGPLKVDAGTAVCRVPCGHYARLPDGTHRRAEFDPGDRVAWVGYEEAIRGGRTRYIKVDCEGGGTATFPRSYFFARFDEVPQ